MSAVYFPGCKYTIHSRVNSRKIRQYLIRQHGIRQTGCCSTGLDTLREEDIAVYTCPTCSAFIQEYTPKNRSLSIWEILENDDAFPWPDYSGDTVTVQDCWRSFDNRPMQDAVRHILGLMNVETVEIAKNFEKTDFCGSSLMKTQSPRYSRFAPVRFFRPMQKTNSSRCLRKNRRGGCRNMASSSPPIKSSVIAPGAAWTKAWWRQCRASDGSDQCQIITDCP